MKLYYFRSGPLRVNTYFLVNEITSEAIIIDCGENYKLVRETESKFGFKITSLLLTHAHFDHAGIAGRLQREGVKVYISKIDAKKLLNQDNLAGNFGRKFDSFVPDYTFDDGEKLNINGIEIRVMLTPGHTDGSATFIVGDMLFTGDTLFLECVGRTDFVSGDKNQLIKSVKNLFALDGEYTVYPGHEEFTTLSHEREFNIFRDYD